MTRENNIPPFYVGQEVVAIKDHSCGFFKKSQEFKVTSCIMGCCNWQVTIGIPSALGYTCRCGKRHYNISKEQPFAATSFAPKQKFKPITFEKIMEEELVSEN